MSARTARNIIATVAVTVLAVGSLTAVSSAATQYGTACADNKTGALRVLVAGAKHCTTKEQVVGLGATAAAPTQLEYADPVSVDAYGGAVEAYTALASRTIRVPAGGTDFVEVKVAAKVEGMQDYMACYHAGGAGAEASQAVVRLGEREMALHSYVDVFEFSTALPAGDHALSIAVKHGSPCLSRGTADPSTGVVSGGGEPITGFPPLTVSSVYVLADTVGKFGR